MKDVITVTIESDRPVASMTINFIGGGEQTVVNAPRQYESTLEPEPKNRVSRPDLQSADEDIGGSIDSILDNFVEAPDIGASEEEEAPDSAVVEIPDSGVDDSMAGFTG